MDNKRLSAQGTYDVVILGAGVAGLLLASELSRTARVLVLERNDHPPGAKYWITTEKALEYNHDLAHTADLALSSMDFIAFDGTTYRCEGAYRLWNTSAVIEALLQRTLQNGADVGFGQSFYSYARNRESLTITANDRSIKARLAIDCMGQGSPIITEGCGDVVGYYLLYGATFAMAGELMPVALHNLALRAHAA
jgi:L-2-hydroxyglutarate oxidase LhgO